MSSQSAGVEMGKVAPGGRGLTFTNSSMTGSLSAFTPFCGTDSDMVGAAVKSFFLLLWGKSALPRPTWLASLVRSSPLLRSRTGALSLPREEEGVCVRACGGGGSADGTGVDFSRGANGARYIQAARLRCYFRLATLKLTSALCAGWSTEEEEEEVWEEVTGIFKAVMSPKEGNVGGFEGRIHAGRVEFFFPFSQWK